MEMGENFNGFHGGSFEGLGKHDSHLGYSRSIDEISSLLAYSGRYSSRLLAKIHIKEIVILHRVPLTVI